MQFLKWVSNHADSALSQSMQVEWEGLVDMTGSEPVFLWFGTSMALQRDDNNYRKAAE